MAARYSTSYRGSVQLRSLFRPRSCGVRTGSVSGSPIGHCRGLILSRSISSNLFGFSCAASRIDIEIQEEVRCLKLETEISKGGKQNLVETLNISVSQEAFQLFYSKKSMVVSKGSPEKPKTQAGKTNEDLNTNFMEPNEDGQVYTYTAAENSPESVKNVMESFASSTDGLKDALKVHYFYIGIPYCALLSLRGFFSFMITGSIATTKFRILGGTFLASSVHGVSSWRKRKSSFVAITGQAAILTVLFLRKAHLVFMRPTITGCIATVTSGAVVSLYVYTILVLYQLTKTKKGD